MSSLVFKRFSMNELSPELLAAWQSISSTLPALHSPFFSPYFAKAVAQALPQQCFVTVTFKDQQPSGFFPFQFTNRLLGRAERIGHYFSDYNGYIAHNALDQTQVQELLRVSGIHQYAFDHLHQLQPQLGFNAEFVRDGTATMLDAGFDNYWKEREQAVPKVAKDTLRCLNKISKEVGPLRLQFHSSDSNDLDQLIANKRRQYQQTGANDGMAGQWQQQFLHNLHATQHSDFKGVLSQLYAGEKPISAHFGIAANGILHYWFPVYEPSYSSYSPGRLLFYFLAQQAADNGIHTIDNGMGAQRHKADFSNHLYKLGVGAIRQPSLRSLILRVEDYLQARPR